MQYVFLLMPETRHFSTRLDASYKKALSICKFEEQEVRRKNFRLLAFQYVLTIRNRLVLAAQRIYKPALQVRPGTTHKGTLYCLFQGRNSFRFP